MELPNARIVKQAGVTIAPPRRRWDRQRARKAAAAIGQPIKQFLSVLVALWPLTAVVLLGIVVIWSIGANASVRP